MSHGSRLTELLESRWPVRRFATSGGIEAVNYEYPLEATGGLDFRSTMTLDGVFKPSDHPGFSDVHAGGSVLGWHADGTPAAAAYCRPFGTARDAAFVEARIADPAARDSNLGRRVGHANVWTLASPLDHEAIAATTVRWLVKEAVCSPAEAQSAVLAHFDGFSAFREYQARLDGPAMQFLNPRNFTASEWRDTAGPDGKGSWLLKLCREWPAFVAPLRGAVDMSDERWTAMSSAPGEQIVALAICNRLGMAIEPSDERLVASLKSLNDGRTALPEHEHDLCTSLTEIPDWTPEENAFALLRHLPPDWWPTTPEECRAALRASVALDCIRGQTKLPLAQIAKSCKGRWFEWCRILAKLAPYLGIDKTVPEPSGLPIGRLGASIGDMLDAFAGQIMVPLSVRSGAMPEPGEEFSGTWWTLRQKASEILLGDAGATGIIEAADRWHARRAAMETAIALVSPEQSEGRTWPAALPPWSGAIDGRAIEISVLTTQRMLTDEGSKDADASGMAGLDHCVGSVKYARGSVKGICRIVSVRERLPDGGLKRLSTAEIFLDPEYKFVLRQHQARSNSVPEPAAASAMEAYMAAISVEGDDPFVPVPAEFEPVIGDMELKSICGYDSRDDAAMQTVLRIWEPMLVRPLRGLTIDGFTGATGLASSVADADIGYVETKSDDLLDSYEVTDEAREALWKAAIPEEEPLLPEPTGPMAMLKSLLNGIRRRPR